MAQEVYWDRSDDLGILASYPTIVQISSFNFQILKPNFLDLSKDTLS